MVPAKRNLKLILLLSLLGLAQAYPDTKRDTLLAAHDDTSDKINAMAPHSTGLDLSERSSAGLGVVHPTSKGLIDPDSTVARSSVTGTPKTNMLLSDATNDGVMKIMPSSSSTITQRASIMMQAYESAITECGGVHNVGGTIVHLHPEHDPHSFKDAHEKLLAQEGSQITHVFDLVHNGMAANLTQTSLNRLAMHEYVKKLEPDCVVDLPREPDEKFRDLHEMTDLLLSSVGPAPGVQTHAPWNLQRIGERTWSLLGQQEKRCWANRGGDEVFCETGDRVHDQSSCVATSGRCGWRADDWPYFIGKVEANRQRPYEYGNFTGKGVNIYVVDSAVRAKHLDFGGRVVSGWNPVCKDQPCPPTEVGHSGKYFVEGGIWENGCSNSQTHGTAVASVAAGTYFGVAKEATIVPVQVTTCPHSSHYTSHVKAGIEWAIKDCTASNKRCVINLSLGRRHGSKASAAAEFDPVIDKAIEANLIVVTSAGNKGEDAGYYSPASSEKVISVGAIDVSPDTRSGCTKDYPVGWSNWGTSVDIWAPGESIAVAGTLSTSKYYHAGGTSFAAPMVSGVIATILGRFPELSPAQVTETLLCVGTLHAVLPQAPCSDQHSSCRHWAREGKCSANPAYMLQGCAESCGICEREQNDTAVDGATEGDIEKVGQGVLLYGGSGLGHADLKAKCRGLRGDPFPPYPPSPSPPPPAPLPPPSTAIKQWTGLCVDGTGSWYGTCGCAYEESGHSFIECEVLCAQLPGCTGFAHHPNGNCKLYTAQLSTFEVDNLGRSGTYQAYACYTTDMTAPVPNTTDMIVSSTWTEMTLQHSTVPSFFTPWDTTTPSGCHKDKMYTDAHDTFRLITPWPPLPPYSPSPPSPLPSPPSSPSLSNTLWPGLCIDGTANGDTCGCAEESSGKSLAECEADCSALPAGCTGFAYHDGGNCKIYTEPLSEWTSSSYRAYTCYGYGGVLSGPPLPSLPHPVSPPRPPPSPPPSPLSPPPKNYVFEWAGLCIDGTANGDTCGCAEESRGKSLTECEADCSALPAGCTGFAYHDGGNCKIYTEPLTSWTSSSYRAYTCYGVRGETGAENIDGENDENTYND